MEPFYRPGNTVAFDLSFPDLIIICIAELSAAAVLVNYWNKSVNNAAWITIFLAVVITINFFGGDCFIRLHQFAVVNELRNKAGVYGECEFVFSCVLRFIGGIIY